MSTAFDIESLEWIDPLVGMHKIASADITNIPLIRAIASKAKPVCLSTGAASFDEIETAVNELKTYGNGEIALLHCVLNYPCLDENAYLGRIHELILRYPNVIIGYSDHTIPDSESLAVIAAYGMGARVIEKHFTHDKTLEGNDHYHAMDATDLEQLSTRLNQIGSMSKTPSESEFLSSQEAAIQNARRSIVTSRNINSGEVLSSENLTTKRPASGLSPLNWDKLIGRIVKENLPEDYLISFKDTLDDGV
jgi:N-acetylneuraminate synthase